MVMELLKYIIILIIGASMLIGCTSAENNTNNYIWQDVPNRDNGNKIRFATYRIKIPSDWKVQLPLDNESIQDTTLPNATFFLSEEVIMTIHTFPSNSIKERIPVGSQIARWKKQFTTIEPLSVFSSFETRGGFAGIFFEASGTHSKYDKTMSVLAWSMQLDSRHYHTLESLNKNIQADYTIKTIGPKHIIEQYKEELIMAAKTFELIQAIPEENP